MKRMRVLYSQCGTFGAPARSSTATSSNLPPFPQASQLQYNLGQDLPAPKFDYDRLKLDLKIRQTRLSNAAVEMRQQKNIDSFDNFVRFARRVLESCGGSIEEASDRFAACLLQNCSRHDLHVPTAVQARCWPLMLRGHSLRVTAPTGSGKTLSYLLPTLLNVLATPPPVFENHSLNESNSGFAKKCAAPNALIIVPSSELAFQVQKQALRFGQPRSLLRPAVLCGGVMHEPQHRALVGESPPRIVISTLGRVFDMLEAGSMTLDNITNLIIDEDDSMLSQPNHAESLMRVINRTPSNRQISFWSATRNNNLDNDVLPRCLEVDLTRGSSFPVSLTHEIVFVSTPGSEVDAQTEFDPLFDWLRKVTVPGPCLIFTRSRTQADRLAGKLKSFGAKAAALHAGANAGGRNKTLKEFSAGDIDLLCCTDLLQRGIDLRVRYVINLAPPRSKEMYIHRAGRTARAGRPGHCVSFLPVDGGQDFELDSFLTSEGVDAKISSF